MNRMLTAVLSAGLCAGALAQAPEPAEAPAARGLDTLLHGADGIRSAIEAIEAYLDREAPQPFVLEPDNAVTLDVREAVRMALENNAQVLQADADVRAAEARVGQARSRLFPQVSGNLSLNHTEYRNGGSGSSLGGLGGSLGGGSLGGIGGGFSGLGFLGPGNLTAGQLALGLGSSILSQRFQRQALESLQPDDTTYTQQLTISQVFYAGGSRAAAISASEFLAQSQSWQREATLDELEFQTKQAFYDSMLAATLVRVAEESVRTFERQLADAEEMLEVGYISGFEVLRARTELERRRADLVSAQNAYLLSLTNLRRLIFVPQETPIALNPRVDWAPIETPIDSLVNLANDHRPELLALDEAIAAADQDIRARKGQYLPQLGGQAQYRNTDRAGSSVPDGWTFSVGLEWELYAGGRRKAETQEAAALRDSLVHQRADVERLVELDVTRALIQLRDAMAKVHAERSTLAQAEEGLRLAELRFQEGVGTQTEVLDAELALTAAESQLVQAVRDYAVGNAALERATGSSWQRATSP